MPRIPEISVVIPTRERPTLLLRAIRSALAQTLPDLECIVVVDGLHPATLEALGTIRDRRVRTVVLPKRVGASAARNHGVRASQAKWIAFLDDDDEWYPPKLERQLARAATSQHDFPIVVCQLMMTGADSRGAVPRRAPGGEATLSDYLFRRKTPFAGEGMVPAGSSAFVSRALALNVPFDESLERYQDIDWLLRAAAMGARLELVAEPLGNWTDVAAARITGGGSWRAALAWIQGALRAGLVSREAFASFVMTHCATQAARDRDWRGAWELLVTARRDGRPTFTLYGLYAAFWLVPRGVRRWLRHRLQRHWG